MFIKELIQVTISIVYTCKWFILGIGAGCLVWLKIASWCVSLGL